MPLRPVKGAMCHEVGRVRHVAIREHCDPGRSTARSLKATRRQHRAWRATVAMRRNEPSRPGMIHCEPEALTSFMSPCASYGHSIAQGYVREVQKDRLAAASPNQIGCFGQAAARLPEPVRFLRHQPRRPPHAAIRPGSPAPATGPGTAPTSGKLTLRTAGAPQHSP
jgi:hypothetical protein